VRLAASPAQAAPGRRRISLRFRRSNTIRMQLGLLGVYAMCLSIEILKPPRHTPHPPDPRVRYLAEAIADAVRSC
jgi:hypothetical protein